MPRHCWYGWRGTVRDSILYIKSGVRSVMFASHLLPSSHCSVTNCNQSNAWHRQQAAVITYRLETTPFAEVALRQCIHKFSAMTRDLVLFLKRVHGPIVHSVTFAWHQTAMVPRVYHVPIYKEVAWHKRKGPDCAIWSRHIVKDTRHLLKVWSAMRIQKIKEVLCLHNCVLQHKRWTISCVLISCSQGGADWWLKDTGSKCCRLKTKILVFYQQCVKTVVVILQSSAFDLHRRDQWFV